MTNDPLAWKGGLKARWAMAIHDAMEHIKENLTKIEWPFLVLHGDADQLTMVDGSVMLEEKAASQDKTIKVTFLGCLTYIVILWKSAQFASINSKLQHSPHPDVWTFWRLVWLNFKFFLSIFTCSYQSANAIIWRFFISIVQFFFRQIYPGFYHKLLNEPKEDATLVMNDIISWINQRLPSWNTD